MSYRSLLVNTTGKPLQPHFTDYIVGLVTRHVNGTNNMQEYV